MLILCNFSAAGPQVWNYVSADGPQTAGIVIQPFQTDAGDIFTLSAAPKSSVNQPFTALQKSRFLLSYIPQSDRMVWLRLAASKSRACM